MQSHLPAGDSRAVVFATTADGLRLPVIDVTNPEFAVPDDPVSLGARRDAGLGPSQPPHAQVRHVATHATGGTALAPAPKDTGVGQ
jgi:hypothetical protein